MALVNRPRYGLSSVCYALFDPSTSTYGAVKPLANVMSMGFDPASSMASLWSDNKMSHVADSIGEASLDFQLVDLLPEAQAEILGHLYANGITAENYIDQSATIALGGEIARSGKDGANAVTERFWFPRVVLSKFATDDASKAASIEFKTPSLTGRVLGNANGDYRFRARSDDANVDATTYANFLTSVVESTGVSLTAVTVGTITGDDSDNTIIIPFAKGGETFSLKTVSAGDISVSVVSTGVLLAGTLTYTYSAAGVAPTITITNANITNVPYLVTVTNDVRDSNNVTVTPLSQLVTPA